MGRPSARKPASNSVHTSGGRGIGSTRAKRLSAAKHASTTSKYSRWSVTNSIRPPRTSRFQSAFWNKGPNSRCEWCFFFGHGSWKSA